MNKKICYVMMKLVDLGGHPIFVYLNEAAANKAVAHANKTHETESISKLINNHGYSPEKANNFIKTRNKEFYIDTVSLIE